LPQAEHRKSENATANEAMPVGTQAMKTRCPWSDGNELQAAYHDTEWGVPVHDDRRFFEFLILEGAQAGLSWDTILRKRAAYRRAFAAFDPVKVARFGSRDIALLMENTGIVRNRLKIESAVGNAQAFLAVQGAFGSFDAYIWRFVDGRPSTHRWRRMQQVPASTRESDAMSKDLKGRGFRFVGSTICYALMQATGLVNDHLITCLRHSELARGARGTPQRIKTPRDRAALHR
jgi:DNA-3-methyladenine glycosylase I